MTNHTNKTGPEARHRKDLDPTNAVEANTRWWVINYAPGTAPYVISERPRIIAATFAAIEVTEDGTTVAAFYTETDAAGRQPARCVRRITAECAAIAAHDTWEAAVAAAYAADQADLERGWDAAEPLTEAELDDVFAHLGASAPAESDEEWLDRLASGLSDLPEGVVPLRRRAPSLWDDADPFPLRERDGTAPAGGRPDPARL